MEDGCHFTLECDVYSTLRRKCISRYFYVGPNMYKFCQLFKATSKKKKSNLAIFINEALDISNEMNMTFSKHYFILCISF